MRKFLLVLPAVAALSLAAAPPASAAPNHTYDVHGVVLTEVAGNPLANPLHIVSTSAHPSTMAMLGRVTLSQWQLAVPTSFQTSTSGPTMTVPATGNVQVTAGTLTAASGSSTLTFTQPAGTWTPFTPDTTVTAPNGLHPIKFAGALTVTGGTGRFTGATGTLHLVGGYCFVANAGFMVIDGTLVLAQ